MGGAPGVEHSKGFTKGFIKGGDPEGDVTSMSVVREGEGGRGFGSDSRKASPRDQEKGKRPGRQSFE